MPSYLQFILAVMLLGIVSLFIQFRSIEKMKEFFFTKEGIKVFIGIVIFTSAGLFTAIVFAKEPKGTFFTYGEVYLGLDMPVQESPQCLEGQNSKYVTSHGGLRINLYQSADRRFELNTKYTHHSCAFNPDDKVYDAIGIETSFQLW